MSTTTRRRSRRGAIDQKQQAARTQAAEPQGPFGLPGVPSETHRRAAERVIEAMRGRAGEPLTLNALARIAYFSPFHFSRVFRRVTGLTPGRFLAAVRMQKAKRLLLTTHYSVTAISYEVGYNSVGTFSRLFTEFVGVQPYRLRRHADEVLERCSEWLDPEGGAPLCRTGEAGPGFKTTIRGETGDTGPVFLGLFREPIPRGQPAACVLAPRTGAIRIPSVGDGTYYLFAAAPGPEATPTDLLVGGGGVRGRSRPFAVTDGVASRPIEVGLRPPSPVDPPILLSLPFAYARAKPDTKSA